MGNNIGLLEYASLLKTQKNPYERAISTEAAVMNAMPKDGGFTGLEGIGKIPLMYAMGRDTANAQAFDQQQDEGVAGYIKQRQELEQQQLRKQAQSEAMKNYIAIAKEDPAAANQLATTDPLLKDSPFGGLVLKEKMDKNNWLSLDKLNEDGTVKTTYHVNLQGLKTASDKLAAEGIDNPTIEQIHANMPTGFSIKTEGAAKVATDDKFSLHGGYSNGQHATYRLDPKTGEYKVIGTAPIKASGDGGNGDGSGTADLDNTVSMVWRGPDGKNYSQNFDIRKPDDRALLQNLTPGVSSGYARVTAIGKNAMKKTGLKASAEVHSSSDPMGNVRTSASGYQNPPAAQPAAATNQISREEAIAELKRRGVM